MYIKLKACHGMSKFLPKFQLFSVLCLFTRRQIPQYAILHESYCEHWVDNFCIRTWIHGHSLEPHKPGPSSTCLPLLIKIQPLNPTRPASTHVLNVPFLNPSPHGPTSQPHKSAVPAPADTTPESASITMDLLQIGVTHRLPPTPQVKLSLFSGV